MNININHYLKYISPILIAIFIAYFISTLLFFVLPKKGIDYIYYSTNNSNKQSMNKFNETTNLVKKRLTLKAIYKKNGAASWVVLENQRTGKTLYLKEGDKFEEATLSVVNKNSVVFTLNEEKFTLKLNIKKTNIQEIINNRR